MSVAIPPLPLHVFMAWTEAFLPFSTCWSSSVVLVHAETQRFQIWLCFCHQICFNFQPTALVPLNWANLLWSLPYANGPT